MLKRIVAVAAVIALLLVPPPPAAASAAPSKNIVETAAGAPQFSTLVCAGRESGPGPVGALSGKARLTVFAPTNAAFAKVPKKTLEKLGESKRLLRKVLLYHVLSGRVPAAKVIQQIGQDLGGRESPLQRQAKSAYVNQARVITADIRASNGIVHAINRVLIPPNL